MASLAVAGALATGCSLFQPRDAQAPLAPPLHVSYSHPDSTLDTMRRGVENRTAAGVDAYAGGLADTTVDQRAFYADLDADATQQWRSTSGKDPPATWPLDRERNFIGRFVTEVITKECQMTWLPDDDHPHDEEIGPNERVLHRHYLVETLPLSTGGGTRDTVSIGFADLTFQQVSPGKWVITRWQDRVDPAIGSNPIRPGWLSFTARRLETY